MKAVTISDLNYQYLRVRTVHRNNELITPALGSNKFLIDVM